MQPLNNGFNNFYMQYQQFADTDILPPDPMVRQIADGYLRVMIGNNIEAVDLAGNFAPPPQPVANGMDDDGEFGDPVPVFGGIAPNHLAVLNNFDLELAVQPEEQEILPQQAVEEKPEPNNEPIAQPAAQPAAADPAQVPPPHQNEEKPH